MKQSIEQKLIQSGLRFEIATDLPALILKQQLINFTMNIFITVKVPN